MNEPPAGSSHESSLTAPGGVLAAPRALVGERLDAGGDVCVVGGPGTGKTALLRCVHRDLVKRGSAQRDAVAVLAPNRESADSLRDSLSAGREGVRGGPAARSIHSYAFSLVSVQAQAEFGTPVSFVSGADQDALLATLLAGYEEGRQKPPAWPPRFAPTLRTTRGFRDQLREALNEVMGRGCTQAQLQEWSTRFDHPEWLALAQILQDYDDLLAVPGFGGVDTAAVFAQAAEVIALEERNGARAGQAWSFSSEKIPSVILLDAAQDLPDAALPMIEGLRSLGAQCVVFASPDTVSQGFRGAGGAFVSASARWTPGEAPVILTQPQRAAGALTQVYYDLARRVSDRLELGHVPAVRPAEGTSAVGESSAGMMQAAAPLPSAVHTAQPSGSQRASDAPSPSSVHVRSHPSDAAQVRALAGLLRAWHHTDGVPWSQCAVLTRTSGTAASLADQLRYLGIPVASPQRALSSDPVTQPLLTLLQLDESDPIEVSRFVRRLLQGPLIGLDAIALRGLERELASLPGRLSGAPGGGAEADASAVDSGGAGDQVSADSPDPAATSIIDAALAHAATGDLPAALQKVRALLLTAARVRRSDPHTALWELWKVLDVDRDWKAQALKTPADERNEWLDAVIRLMTLAQKTAERSTNDAASFASMVLQQQFAQDSLAPTASADIVTVAPPAAVSHTTFSHVAIVDLEEGTWPNPQVRGSYFDLTSLLDVMKGRAPQPLTSQEYANRRRLTIGDEGRLLLSAMSRATDTLVINSVDDGEKSPGVFFRALEMAAPSSSSPDGSVENTQEPLRAANGVSASELPVSLREVAARARRAMVSSIKTTGSELHDPLSEAVNPWAQLLRSLQEVGVREADPESWIHWHQVTSTAPIYTPDDTVGISPSRVQTFLDCPLQWFLTTRGGQSDSSTAQEMGTLIHAVAEQFPNGGLLDMQDAFRKGLADLTFSSAWERETQSRRGEDMIVNLNDFLVSRRADGYELVAVEAQIKALEPSPAANGPWRVSGRIDRLERDSDGRLHVVDFKTSKTPVPHKEVRENPQLATYQAALELPGATVTRDDEQNPASQLADADDPTAPTVSGGAELVYPGAKHSSRTVNGEQQWTNRRIQPPLAQADDPSWAHTLLSSVAADMRKSVFTATPSPAMCRHCPVYSSCPAQIVAGEDS